MSDIEAIIKKIPLARGAEIIAWHECGLFAISKRAGVKAHPNAGGISSSVIMARYNFQKEYYSFDDPEDGKTRYHIHLVNRLDSPTSGVMLASVSAGAANAAKAAFKNRQGVEKIYKAIVFARNLPQNGVWRDYIREVRYGGHVRAELSHAGKRAETKYEFESSGENNLNLSLIKLSPVTGFTHQLRVQCRHRKMPIIGDATYGEFGLNKKIKRLLKLDRLFLHCQSTKVSFELDGETVEFSAEAPLPESFGKVMNLVETESAI